MSRSKVYQIAMIDGASICIWQSPNPPSPDGSSLEGPNGKIHVATRSRPTGRRDYTLLWVEVGSSDEEYLLELLDAVRSISTTFRDFVSFSGDR